MKSSSRHTLYRAGTLEAKQFNLNMYGTHCRGGDDIFVAGWRIEFLANRIAGMRTSIIAYFRRTRDHDHNLQNSVRHTRDRDRN